MDAPDVYGPRKTLYNRFVRWAAKGIWTDIFHTLASAGGPPAHVLIDSTAVKAHRCAAADTLLEQMPATGILHGDKGYDSNAVRRKIEATGAAPDIPPKINRIWKPCFAPLLYRDRNAIERMFSPIKDFRRIATRYDRLARNFLAAVCLVASICYWL